MISFKFFIVNQSAELRGAGSAGTDGTSRPDTALSAVLIPHRRLPTASVGKPNQTCSAHKTLVSLKAGHGFLLLKNRPFPTCRLLKSPDQRCLVTCEDAGR